MSLALKIDNNYQIKTENEDLEINAYKDWLITTKKTIGPSEGLNATINSLKSVNSVTEKFFVKNELTNNLRTMLSNTSGILSSIGWIGYIKWWACEKADRLQETISMIFFTTLQGLGSIFLLEELGAFSLKRFSFTVGQIPGISLVTKIFSALGSLFNLWHHKIAFDIDVQKAEKNVTKYEKFNMKIDIIKNDTIAMKKRFIAVINDVAGIAMTIFGLTNLCLGVSLFAGTGAFMVLTNVSTSLFSLYKCYFDEKHKDIKVYDQFLP